jgi:hypothetical protein
MEILTGIIGLGILYGTYKLGAKNGSNVKFKIFSFKPILCSFECGNTLDETKDKILDLAKREATYKKNYEQMGFIIDEKSDKTLDEQLKDFIEKYQNK